MLYEGGNEALSGGHASRGCPRGLSGPVLQPEARWPGALGQSQPWHRAPGDSARPCPWDMGLGVGLAEQGPWLGRGAWARPCCGLAGAGADGLGDDVGAWACAGGGGTRGGGQIPHFLTPNLWGTEARFSLETVFPVSHHDNLIYWGWAYSCVSRLLHNNLVTTSHGLKVFPTWIRTWHFVSQTQISKNSFSYFLLKMPYRSFPQLTVTCTGCSSG